MTIIAARRYRDGKPLAPSLDLEAGEPLAPGEFDWVGLYEPSAQEMALIGDRYHLHPLAIEDALSIAQQPKVETFGETVFVIAKTAEIDKLESIVYGHTAMFVGPNFIVTVRLGSHRAHDRLRAQLELNAERLSEGADFVLHAVLDFIVDGYFPLLDHLEHRVTEMEEGAVSKFPDQARIRRIFRLRRGLRKFEVVAAQMEETAGKLLHLELPCIDARARPYFRDVYDHARRAETRAHGLNETMAGIIEIAGLLEQSRQGAITRQLAAWAAILAVPTAIAGIYGMNFRFMPELTWRYGYFIVLAAIAAICAMLFLRFRRIGWL
ncbi:MAG TPA: magnesium and cobalt transport protein CorA [Croceibacterium sp.]|nr:magnesium and cobalt transport protein CorA [Croceibacterium sp.]